MNARRVYLAGPCFSAAELLWNVAVKNSLMQLEIIHVGGFEFYLPQERVKETWAASKIQKELVTGLTNSQIIVANLDGPGGDDGTCWEMGFVAGVNSVLEMVGHNPRKDIFWYRTDFRRGGDSELNVNLMMAYGGTQISLSGTTPTEVAKSISHVLEHSHE